ncbi:putative iron-regulated transporter protein [Botrytis fragariae]|uniref:Solute carrier family 40 member n=1 Tax=Botrytis fragariae TaxID=1964551 RepID=A0A8H6AMG4_9HELO|nr:putative iron-regulated transporter protein [Botrytis fragariae]KAF5869945.1 putative iron-regulated transporter protein [Botrytis fragariae]
MVIVGEHCSTHAEAVDENRTGGIQIASRAQNLDSRLHLDAGSDSVSDDGDGYDEDEEDALISNGAEQEVMQTEMNVEMEMEMEVEMNLNKTQAWALYLSHFLSTWNGRSYEFAAIIFTASAWPDTLVAASIRGIVRTLASICFSSTVGRWVDQSPDRLKTLLTTITINRIAVICASILWFFVVESENNPENGVPLLQSRKDDVTLRDTMKIVMFLPILGFGILEALSANGNMLSMERDWVVVAAAPAGNQYDLTHLNSSMRRIDLSCKLLAPILISFLISRLGIKIGVIVVGGMSAASWGLEMWSARRVWRSNARLQRRKEVRNDEVVSDVEVRSVREKFMRGLRLHKEDFRNYFSSKVWIPSMSLSLLHFSALSYGATFITFLLNAGFSLDLITLARAAGSVVEISSTVVTPFGVRHLSKAHGHGPYDRLHGSNDSDEVLLQGEGEIDESGRITTGLERLGLWGLSWQFINLVYPGNSHPLDPLHFHLYPQHSSPLPHHPPLSPSSPLLALFLFATLSLSRLGLWIFDLTTQQLSQTLIAPTQRSSFAGCEYSLVALFELGNYVMAIIWSRPDQFGWVALL